MEYDIESEIRICWWENPNGYLIENGDILNEGISLEGLEGRIIDTDCV
jgi:hypothetical protein